MLPHGLPVSRDKCLITHILSLVRTPRLPKSEQPSPPPSPFPLGPDPLLAHHRGGRWPSSSLGMEVASQEALSSPHPLPLTSGRCHGEGLGCTSGASHHLHRPGPCSGSLLHCCFPKAVLIRNEGQLDMAETTTWVCFPASCTPSVPLGREGSRAGFIPQRVSPAIAQDLAWLGSGWRAPDHPSSSRTAVHPAEHEKCLPSGMCVPVWVSLHTAQLLSPQTSAVPSGERRHVQTKEQAACAGEQRSALYTPPLLASHQHYS